MLKKCLKYDLKSTLSIWWIGAVTLLVLSVPVGLCLRRFTLHVYDDSHIPVELLGVMLGYLALIAFGIVTTIIVYLRYYNNFFRDEGYLTFTLPVCRQTLFLSKVLSTMIIMAATGAVIMLCIVIVLSMAPNPDDQSISLMQTALRFYAEPLEILFEGAGGWAVVYLTELAALTVAGILSSTLLVFLCITVGAVIARKHKLIASIGLLYGFEAVASVAIYVLMILMVLLIISALAAFPNIAIGNAPTVLIGLLLGLACVVTALVDTLLAFVTLGILERKLNLP